MINEGFKRKLTAILSADAVGYSRLMREDEEATVRDIAARIAARVEGLASARGIAISGTVYEHIKDKLSLGYH